MDPRLAQLEELLRDAFVRGDSELLAIVLADLLHEFPDEP